MAAPNSYYGQRLDPRVKPQRPDLGARAIGAGRLARTWRRLGSDVHGEGSRQISRWHVRRRVRTPLNGYKVVVVPFSDGKPSGPAEDVVTGFLGATTERKAGRLDGMSDAKGL